ncbi:hypothetical protein DPMN_135811 [Dreissena polymorpha]|uniref:Uncharacterized protein n=1 Tax=Dreissena polymorpha TaxID=45954 RepID=A0A9D4JC24_DREPO|nr:hypothetical protein DPMN_135811 [Dreissena polymorpha]
MESTLSQFQEQYGFDPSNMFTNENELTTENETIPSNNFGSDAPSSRIVIPPTLNQIPDMPYNKEFLDVNLTDENKKSVAKTLSDMNTFKRFLVLKAETKKIPQHRTNSS